jgi:ribosomal protein S18 acetylase RimI-like enzyme
VIAAGATVAAALAPLIRDLTPADRTRVDAMVRGTGLFRDDEAAVALEVFDGAAASSGPPRDYFGTGAVVDGQLAGWIAWGPTPCTAGTYDLYWLVIDPELHGRGIGTALVHEMERRLAGTARLIVVETAGRPAYAGTRAFYEARGYRRTATIPDFYAADDDLVVYVKALTTLAR